MSARAGEVCVHDVERPGAGPHLGITGERLERVGVAVDDEVGDVWPRAATSVEERRALATDDETGRDADGGEDQHGEDGEQPGLAPSSQAGAGNGQHRAASRHERLLGHHPAVAQVDRPVGGVGDIGVVGDHDDGLAGVVLLTQEVDHGLRRRRVERAGGLVGQEQVGPVRQGPADGDALLLAAGEGAGQGVCLVGEAERVEQLGGPRLGLSPVPARRGAAAARCSPPRPGAG